MSISHHNGLALASVSHFNGLAKASVGSFNGDTYGGGGGGAFASDLFTTGSDAALTTYSANWVYCNGALKVDAAADEVRSMTSDEVCTGFWNALTFTANQYSEVIRTTLQNDSYYGPTVRCVAGGTCYHITQDGQSGQNYLQRAVANSHTILGDNGNGFTMTLATGDVCRLEVITFDASTVRLTVKKALAASPTSFSTVFTVDDTSGARLLTGKPGFCGYGYQEFVSGGVTEWRGGDL